MLKQTNQCYLSQIYFKKTTITHFKADEKVKGAEHVC